jgi:hypothetical protein
MRYFANVGPDRGPILWRDAKGAIGVLQAPEDHMPIGMALGCGPDGAGVATWSLTVRGADLPGRWVVIDREFRLVQ